MEKKKPYLYNDGDIIEGTITNVVNYGAFMIFDHEIEGLLHISEITEHFVYNIKNMMKVGTTRRVKVMEVNPDNGFLKLSIKKIEVDEIERQHQEQPRTPVDKEEIDFSPLENKMKEWKEEK